MNSKHPQASRKSRKAFFRIFLKKTITQGFQKILADLRVLIHMKAGVSTVDGTQIPDMFWKMALLTGQMPYQANGSSVPPRHPSP